MIRDQELAQLAKAVADWLPPGWRFNGLDSPEWEDAEILGPDRMRLAFRRSWHHKGMITIYGRDSRQSINCNPSRTPKAIAADIKRRLLDDYAKEYAEWQANRTEQAEKTRQLELIAQCFERLGLVRQSWQSTSYEITLHGQGCTAKVSDYRTELEIRVSADDALRVVGFLNSLRKTDENTESERAPPE